MGRSIKNEGGHSQGGTQNHGPMAAAAPEEELSDVFLYLSYRSCVSGRKDDIFEGMDKRDRKVDQRFSNAVFEK